MDDAPPEELELQPGVVVVLFARPRLRASWPRDADLSTELGTPASGVESKGVAGGRRLVLFLLSDGPDPPGEGLRRRRHHQEEGGGPCPSLLDEPGAVAVADLGPAAPGVANWKCICLRKSR